MKKIRYVFYASLLFIAGCDSAVKTSDINKDIIQTLDHYFNGRRQADISMLSEAFFENARLETVDTQGKVINITLDDYLNVVKNKGKVSVKTQIMYLSITGNIAVAQTRFDYGEKIYIDYLTLLKTDKGWRISNKAFTKL